jgi:formamidopyrimidine-DNA glycosylase
VPELPEVETIRRSLAPLLTGRVITAAHFLSPHAANHQPAELAARLAGVRIAGLDRLGKHLLLRLDSGTLDIHLRMTGKLLWNAAPGPHARALLEFGQDVLVFDDIRQFGRLRWWAPGVIPPGLGPDALDLPFDAFAARLRTRRGRLKPLLLDQSVLAGLGNIYVDEALFLARIHPLTPAARLGPVRLERLHTAIQQILAEALAAGGSSISDYVDASGERGAFQDRHQVYARTGQPCPLCASPIRRIVVTQRGTHFCPACQRR